VRTPTATEEKILTSPARRAFVRVSVADSGGTFRDLTIYPESNFVRAVEWGEDLNDAIPTATVTLQRAIGDRSLAPLHATSPLNRAFNPANAFAALVQVGRQMKIEAGVAADGDHAPTTWNLVFHGLIDAVEWPGEEVSLECVGLEGRLRDVWIETERVYAFAQGAGANMGVRAWEPSTAYAVGAKLIPTQGKMNGHYYTCWSAGTSGALEPTWPTTGGTVANGTANFIDQGSTSTTVGTAVETVMQQILNDNLGAGAVTLYTPVSPGWAVRYFAQQRESLHDALKRLAEQIGWCLRYRYDTGTSAFRLTLFDPGRTKTTPDRQFSASQILDVSKCRVEISEIRNAIRVIYPDQSAIDPKGFPTRKILDVTDATSITKYGRRFMEIAEGETSNLNTTAEATTLANAALSDLKEPNAEYGVDLDFFPWLQTTDLIRFLGDGLRFTGDQDLALLAVSHTIDGPSFAKTSITTRGKPSIGVSPWLSRDARLAPGDVHQTILQATGEPFQLTRTDAVAGSLFTINQGVQPGLGFVQAGELHVSPNSGFAPDSSTMAAAGTSSNVTLNNLLPGQTYYAKFVPFTYNGAKQVRGQPSEEISFVAGRNKAGHYDSLVSQYHFPLNGAFEHQTANVLTTPPDHWSMAAGTWGASADVFALFDATYGNHLRFNVKASDPQIRSAPFPVRRGGGRFNTYLSVRPLGTFATAFKRLVVYMRFYTRSDLSDSPLLYTYFVPTTVATPGVWATHVIDSQFIGALPSDRNFCVITFGKEDNTDPNYGWDIGDVYFCEAQQQDLWAGARLFAPTIYGTALNTMPSVYQEAWTAPTLLNSFQNYSTASHQPAGYFKDAHGVVHLRGLMKHALSTALNTPVFQLPAGYIPQKGTNFLIMANELSARVEIDAVGNIRVLSAVSAAWNSYFSFDGITFDTRA
jgi:hypothetical protein